MRKDILEKILSREINNLHCKDGFFTVHFPHDGLYAWGIELEGGYIRLWKPTIIDLESAEVKKILRTEYQRRAQEKYEKEHAEELAELRARNAMMSDEDIMDGGEE